MWLSLGKCTQCFSVKWAKTSSPRVNKPLTAVHVAFIPALFLTEECCTHFQWFLSLLFKCSDWWSILELQLRSQGSLLPVPTERERERERPWLGLVTRSQNKINSEGGVLCLSNFLSGLFSWFTQWSKGQDRFAKPPTITEIREISAWTELSPDKQANYQRRNKKTCAIAVKPMTTIRY